MEQAFIKIVQQLQELEEWSDNDRSHGRNHVYEIYNEMVWVALDVGAGKMTERVEHFIDNEIGIRARRRKDQEEHAIEQFIKRYHFHPTDIEKKREWIDHHMNAQQPTDEQRFAFLFGKTEKLMSPFWKPEFE